MNTLCLRGVPTQQLQAMLEGYKACRGCDNCAASLWGGRRCSYVAKAAARELKRRGEA